MIRRLSRTAVGIAMSGAGAVVPISVAYAALRIPGINAGAIAAGLAAAAFFGQLGNAFFVEAHLLGENRVDRAQYLPSVFVILLVPALAACVLGAAWMPIWAFGFAYLASILEVSRMQSIVRNRWAGEVLPTALVLGSSILTCVYPRITVLILVLPLMMCVVIALRCNIKAWVPFGVPSKQGWWVVAEATASSFTQPAMTFVIMSGLGPLQALVYRLVGSIANLMSPILAYVRMRLLSRRSRVDFVLGILLVSSACVFIFVADRVGVLPYLLGDRWHDVGLIVLISAVIWKASSLLSVWPYAALRRYGQAFRVFCIRLVSSGLYFVLAWIGMDVIGVDGVFIGFAIAEVTSWAIYQINLMVVERGLPSRQSVGSAS